MSIIDSFKALPRQKQIALGGICGMGLLFSIFVLFPGSALKHESRNIQSASTAAVSTAAAGALPSQGKPAQPAESTPQAGAEQSAATMPAAMAVVNSPTDENITEGSVSANLLNRYGLAVPPQVVNEICREPSGDKREWLRECQLRIVDMRVAVIRTQVEAEKRALGRLP